MKLNLVLVGASHRTASVDDRGRMASAAGRATEWFRARAAAAGVAELMVLSTCHRVEIVALLRPDASAAARTLVEELLGVTLGDPRIYIHRDDAALLHAARVASGLDSLIVGEAEVSGQLRRAMAEARAAGTIGPTLDRLVAGALAASGRARAETRIGAGTVSAAGAAVSMLEHAWTTLSDRAVLVVGAGEAARQALHRLRRRGASRLFVASRSMHHAREAAARYAAEALPLEAVRGVLSDVDGIITAARATAPLIDDAMCAGRSAARPLHIVDLSVPRVVDPAVAEVRGVTLATVDDLGDVVRAALARRTREIPRVDQILADETARLYARTRVRRPRATVA